MLELYYVTKMLAINGVLVLHDVWLPSVKKTIAYIDNNLSFMQRQRLSRWHNARTVIAVYVKVGTDKRLWDHYADF